MNKRTTSNWVLPSLEVYHVMLLLPINCSVFLEKTTMVLLADVTLLVGVHKYILNFWFKRVEDCYIKVSQIVKTKNCVMSDINYLIVCTCSICMHLT